MTRRRSTRLELEQQLLQIQDLLDRFPDGLSAPEIRAGLEDLFGVQLDARLLRLRLTKMLELGHVAAEGATRGRRYHSTGGYTTLERGSSSSSRRPAPGPPRAPSSPPRLSQTPLTPPPRFHQDLFAYEPSPDGPAGDAQRARHVSSLRWRGTEGYFIEYDPRISSYPDSLHVGPTGRIPTFVTMAEALLHAARMGFDIEDPTQVFGEYDLDHIYAWCANPRPEDIEYELFAHVLDLVGELPDIELDEELAAAHDASDAAFSKLIKSTDSTLLPGEPFPYIAQWTSDDIASMKRTFDLGVRALVNRLVAWPPYR